MLLAGRRNVNFAVGHAPATLGAGSTWRSARSTSMDSDTDDQREHAIRALPADRRAETGPRDSGTAEAAPFRTILFPPGREMLRSPLADEPACFIDLNLDQIVAAIVMKSDEDVLRPFFYSPYRDEETVRSRKRFLAISSKRDIPGLSGLLRSHAVGPGKSPLCREDHL